MSTPQYNSLLRIREYPRENFPEPDVSVLTLSNYPV
jgi:hypothetical protein